MTPEQIADSPMFLTGSAAKIRDGLEKRRERYGFSYIVVQGRDHAAIETFAEKVVASEREVTVRQRAQLGLKHPRSSSDVGGHERRTRRGSRALGAVYARSRGRVHLTGLQALVRMVLEQLRRDARAAVGALFSGYPGSPLAGFDQLLRSLAKLLERSHVRFSPGLNEELAASAVAGTQLLEVFPHATGRRARRLLRQGAGASTGRSTRSTTRTSWAVRLGGALAVVGDDPFAKSSSSRVTASTPSRTRTSRCSRPRIPPTWCGSGSPPSSCRATRGCGRACAWSPTSPTRAGIFDLDGLPASFERPELFRAVGGARFAARACDPGAAAAERAAPRGGAGVRPARGGAPLRGRERAEPDHLAPSERSRGAGRRRLVLAASSSARSSCWAWTSPRARGSASG